MKPTILRSKLRSKPTSKQKSIAPFAQHLMTALFFTAALFSVNAAAQTAPPPNFGDETKGEPAIEEGIQASDENTTSSDENEVDEQTTGGISRATVIESRRESGQVYSIELQHSKAPNQYIEETDSDGNIEYQSADSEETPNLPKWKLGSW